MPISYDAEADSFHFSKSKKSVTVSNISRFWNSLINNTEVRQKNYFVLEGDEVVTTIAHINHPGDGEFESYSGNQAEITTKLYSNLVLINMTFYMQAFSYVAYCDSSGDSNYSHKIEIKNCI